jgi:hypothetical protein
MATEAHFEDVIEQARRLAIGEQLRLISHLSAALSQQLQATNQARRTSADFYGIMQGVTYDGADFEAAEWHPTEESLGAN